MNSNPSMAGLASLVQSRGRNGDSMLVHMTPGEVKGLHALALAHGGSLTINPDTGLVEANFLKKLLPTVLGFGLNFLFPGLGALGSAALVGAGETIRTKGDLGKGLMAGLGAFGGAGLGSAVSGIGAAATDTGTKILAQEAAQNLGKEAGAKAAQEAVTNQIKHQAANQAATLGGRLSNFGAGAKELFTGSQNLGLGGFGGVKALGSTMGMPAISGLGMTAANAMSPDMQIPGGGYEIDDSYYESGDYDPVTGTFRQGQWRKGYPGFPPPGMAGGGVIPAPNGNYPLARPSNSVGGYGPDIDPYTGEERFAAGGAAVGRRSYEEMPIDPELARPNSAKAGWMQYMQQNPAEQQRFIDSGYPAEFFQQNPETFTGNRPFIAGKDEATRASEQARLAQQGITSPSAMPQYQSAPQSADSFASYLQNLNQYVTSPVAAPTPPAQQPPPARVTPPGAGGRPVAGGSYSGDGRMRWDSTQGRFVADAPQGRFGGTDPFSDIGNIDLSNFGNIDFSRLQELMGGMSGARGGNTPGPRDRNMYDQFTGDMGDDMGDMGSRGVPPTTSMGGGMYGPTTGNQQIEMGDMGDVAYAGGTPGFDMTGGMGGMGDMGEGSYAPDMSMYGQQPSADLQALMNLQSQGFGRTDSPEMQGPFRSIESPVPQYQRELAPDLNPYSPRIIEEEPSAMAHVYQPPAMTPFSEPERNYMPEPYMSEMQGGFGSMGDMQQPAPQPVSDMGGFGMFGGGDGGLGFSGMGQPAPQQPAPSFDMSGFGGFGGMPQQPAPSFDMNGMSGGMDFGGGMDYSDGGFAGGGAIQYAAGGKFLRGPGDGMSDDIKANINGEQEARLADGEFVIPADVVSHIGNGSSEAGADRLYKMMVDIRKARTGKTRQAPEINVKKYLPA
jgi:hypothetical protein